MSNGNSFVITRTPLISSHCFLELQTSRTQIKSNCEHEVNFKKSIYLQRFDFKFFARISCFFVIMLASTLVKIEAATKVSCKFATIGWTWSEQRTELRTCDPDIKNLDDENSTISSPRDNLTLGFHFSYKNGVKFIPTNFVSAFPNLVAIEMFKCSVKSINENHFKGLALLKVLELGENKIEHIHSDSFAYLVSLEYLSLSHNKIRFLDGRTFSVLKALKELNLGYNEIQFLHPRIFECLVNAEKIRLDNNKIDHLDGNMFQNLMLLKDINLHVNNLLEIPKNLFKNNLNLAQIMLARNKIKSIAEDVFDNLLALKIVDLSENLCVDQNFTSNDFDFMRKYFDRQCITGLTKESLLLEQEKLFFAQNKLETTMADLEKVVSKKTDALHKEINALKKSSPHFISVSKNILGLIFLFCIALFFVVFILVVVYPPSRVFKSLFADSLV